MLCGMMTRQTLPLLLLAVSAMANSTGLEEGFRNVPDSAKPWAYYWWLNGNVDEATITRDLEAMKQAGFGGLLLFDVRGYHDDPGHVPAPPSAMDFMSEPWRRMLKFTLAEAHRLGLEVSVNLSRCAGALMGPWEVGEDVPKKLVWTSCAVTGPRCTIEWKKPEGKHFWDVAVLAVRHAEAAVPPMEPWQNVAETIGSKPRVLERLDLTAKVDRHGRLVFDVPPGQWTLLRFGCMTMEGDPAHHGQLVTNRDVDVLDPNAVERHFNRMGKTILRDAGPLAGKTLTHFYSVSWEGAIPTWTRGFEKEFARRRGYSIREWLPVLAGFTVKTAADSERFLRDYHKTLGDCFRDNFYGTLHRLCRHHGLKWHAESGGPWNRKLATFAQADQLAFLARTDMPQGEFWWPRRSLNRPPAMTAHIYGKPLAAAEAFTHMQQHWSAYPATLKPRADAAFCDGINHLVWHTFTASPARFGRPGIEYFAGTHINPNVTWFPLAQPFVTYLGRCQFLLRQGKPVVDTCIYVGDRPYLHWDEGPANADIITTEVLLQRLRYQNGQLVLPDGMSYRALVVDLKDEPAPPAALRKIADLRRAGAPETLNVPPDFEGPFRYTHRRTSEADIYFVAGSGDADCVFRVSSKQPELWDPLTGAIRDADNWRATADGRTVVPLRLAKDGSIFVVFRKPGQPRQTPPPPPPVERVLTGPWRVRFGNQSVVFDSLIAWDKHADPHIKYFSGAATYQKSFELTEAEARKSVRLQLGEVHCIAEVKLNGQNLGVVWTAPWSVELTGAAKPGRNELEIFVVNTWVNRLIGDAGLPPEKRTTQTNVALQQGKRTVRAFQGFASEDPLMPSGLLGPVRLEFAQ